MTLSTDIYLRTSRSGQEVYEKVNDLLNIPNGLVRYTRTEKDGVVHISNEPGQGFSAWVIVDFSADGSNLVDDPDQCSSWCDEEDNYHDHSPVHNVKINLDTGYSYRGAGGIGCADLHAIVIVEWCGGR